MTDSTLANLLSASTLDGTETYYAVQGGADKKVTGAQMKTLAQAGLTKASVGLGNVDNTADSAKPVSTAQQTALDAKADAAAMTTALAGKVDAATVGQANGIASLDGGGKVPESQLPAVAITDVFAVSDQASMLALTAQRGDVAVRSDLNKSFVLSTNSPTTLGDWIELRTPTDAVLSVAGKTGAVTLAAADISDSTAAGRTLLAAANAAAQKTALSLAKADVGLGNVDNTSDANKPISSAAQGALNLKADASGISSAYLGNVATRCFQNNNYQLAAAGRWQMTRSAHWARDRVLNPTVILPGWRLNAGNEQASTGGTIKVSIENPSGTFTLANECIAAGNGPVNMSGGNMLFTFTGVDIPRGKKFWVRVLQQNANGVIYRQFQNNGTGSGPDPDDGWEIGTGAISDKTTSGTFTSNILSYFPVAIASYTRRPSFLIFGDSRQEGGGELGSDITYDVGEVPRAIGRAHGYSSVAASATLMSGVLSGAAYANRVALAPYFSHIVNAYGINDLNGGSRTAAQLAADRATFAALFPNSTVIGCTLTPLSSSTDGFFTLANQSAGTNWQKVMDFNELVRAGITGEAFVWDLAAAVDPYRTGFWPVTRNPNATTYGGTQAQFTASIASTGVMTVTAVAAGTLKVGDWIVGSLTGAAPTSPSPCRIKSLGTGTGGTGTYNLDKLGMTVASQIMYTGGVITVDGLHGNLIASEMIRDSGVVNLALAAR